MLAPVEDVWAFLSEPHNLADWWPGIAAVRPDRRGVTAGARWEVVRGREGTLFRKPESGERLLVTAAEPMRRLAFQLPQDRIAADLALGARGPDRTAVTLSVDGPLLLGPRRSLARIALKRLYDLCQTAAER